jgi:DNA-binding response OmpR family regulator
MDVRETWIIGRGRHIEIDELVVDPYAFQAFVGDVELGLTANEFKLLYVLAAEQGRTLTREELSQRAWGRAQLHGDRSVDVCVRRIRMKLAGAPPTRSFIHTRVGVGYRLAAEYRTADRGQQQTPDWNEAAGRP